MGYIIGDPTFIKHLDDWLFTSKQPDARWIDSKATQIPQMFRTFTGYLYRGMTVDDDFLEKVYQGKLAFDTYMSWSKNEKIAMGFVNDPKYAFTKNAGNKILIKKKIPPTNIVFDIHGFALFMGEDQLVMLGIDDMNYDSAKNEEEVLVKPRVQIRKSDIKVL